MTITIRTSYCLVIREEGEAVLRRNQSANGLSMHLTSRGILEEQTEFQEELVDRVFLSIPPQHQVPPNLLLHTKASRLDYYMETVPDSFMKELSERKCPSSLPYPFSYLNTTHRKPKNRPPQMSAAGTTFSENDLPISWNQNPTTFSSHKKREICCQSI